MVTAMVDGNGDGDGDDDLLASEYDGFDEE